ncbi:MAG: tryptophan synthase alpha chain [Flavobacteriaceae bacterium]|jgi:tryptophan synthase alpha chain
MNIFKKNKKQISIFITAGYPKLESLNEQLDLLESSGIDFVEVGIPFSDPLADGPTIQETSQIAIENGMNLPLLFDQLTHRTTKMPLVIMGYLNPVLNYGIDNFLDACQSLAISSVILPDLSIEIYERFYQAKFEARGVYPSFLITPESTEERIIKTAEICKNSFVYLVSSNATTGGENDFDRLERYTEIKSLCGTTPMFIGFGIKTREDVAKVQSVSDGAIIGSAYLKAVSKGNERSMLDKLTKKR